MSPFVRKCRIREEVNFVLYGSLWGKAVGYLLKKDISIRLEECDKEGVKV